VLEEEGQWEDHKIDGKMPYRGDAANLLWIRNWKAVGRGGVEEECLGGHGLKTGLSAIEEEEEESLT
jgi:hypothetical protein